MRPKDFDVSKNNESIVESLNGRTFGQFLTDESHKIVSSYITESKYNKGLFIRVDVCKNGKKFVSGGGDSYLTPFDKSVDV